MKSDGFVHRLRLSQHVSRATNAVTVCPTSPCYTCINTLLKYAFSHYQHLAPEDQPTILKINNSSHTLIASWISYDPRLSYRTTATSGENSAEKSPLTPPTGPAAEQSSSVTPAKGQKRKKKKQKQKQKEAQTPPNQKSVSPAAVLPTPVTIPNAKKRKQFHLFHPDRPKGSTAKRSLVNYEDLYDEVSNPPPIQPTPDLDTFNSNPEATQTCFFWYHGSCKRSNDRRGCQLRHALLDPPQMVAAPPRFVHPRPCELQWCAGDGRTHKGQKMKNSAEQKRYFEVAVSEDGSAHERADQNPGDASEFFLEGFEEPDEA